MAGGHGCGGRLRHSLAFAKEIRARCVICREPASRVAEDLRLDASQVEWVAKIVRVRMYSPERLALIALNDPGLSESDVAEIFGRSAKWVSIVRKQAGSIRKAESIPRSFELMDDVMQPGDPTPEEIAEKTAELHRSGAFRGRRESTSPVLLATYSRRGHALVPVRAF